MSVMNGDLVLEGSQWMLAGFPVLGMPDEGRSVKYFSLNPFVPDQKNRCPLECAYCVCHQDASWHQHPEKFAAVEPEADLLGLLIDRIFATPEGQSGFPISLCDYSDPLIPVHRDRVLEILQALIDRGVNNMVYITTKVHPGAEFLDRLQALLAQPHQLRVTVFVSLPPLRSGYEEVSVTGRVKLLKDLVAREIPCCWYLRPLVEEWFDAGVMVKLAAELVPLVKDHIILSGIVMSEEVEAILRSRGLVVPDWASAGVKLPLDLAFEQRVRGILSEAAEVAGVSLGPVMGHRLCGMNGNHAYGCLICGKQERYCQLFQLHHYGETIEAVENQRLKEGMR